MNHDPDVKPSIIGTVIVVVCTKCNLVQIYDDVIKQGYCTSEKSSRGWRKCWNKEFWNIATS